MSSVNIKKEMVFSDLPFKPLNVSLTESLGELLALGHVLPDQRLLVAEREGGVIALDMKQMGYYHVAQGELAGEPWMVGF